MQYLAELVQHGLGISVLPPMSLRAVTAHVSAIRIDPPLRRDICAVIAATRPPTGSAQALLNLLTDDLNSRRGQTGAVARPAAADKSTKCSYKGSELRLSTSAHASQEVQP
jgi:hypothetical protein